MAATKWSDDAFLDSLRQQADPLADEAVRQLWAEHEIRAADVLFHTLADDEAFLAADVPEPLRRFVEATGDLPTELDLERVKRGGATFLRHAESSAMVLLCSSLLQGYAAPCLTNILTISDDLEKHPYRRLLGVLQLLVDISKGTGFPGEARLTAQKLRLLHAGIRTLVPRHRPDYEARHGLPVNHEDMLATIMGFSLLVIEGNQRLKLALSDQQADDFYYLWRTFAQMMGIHPPGVPNFELIPEDRRQAAEFYASYCRRQYTGPEENPNGYVLTMANLAMARDLIPRPLRWLGFGLAPRVLMCELLDEDMLERLGQRPVAGHRAFKAFLNLLLRAFQRGMDEVPGPFAKRISHLIFQEMIDRGRGHQVEFNIPVRVAAARRLA